MTASPPTPASPNSTALPARGTEWRGLDHEALIAGLDQPAAVLVTHVGANLRGRIVAHNRSFSNLFRGELVGVTLDRIAPAELGDCGEGRAIWRTLKQQALELEWRLVALSDGMRLLTVRDAETEALRQAVEMMRRDEQGFCGAGGLCSSADGRVLFADSAALRLLGRSDGDAGVFGFLDFERGLDSTRWALRFGELGVKPRLIETTFVRADGKLVDVSVALRRIERDGRLLCVALFKEVGAERSLRSAYSDLHARFDLLSMATRDGLWSWDMLSGEVDYSPRWAALMGFEGKRFTGTIDTWLERVHPGDRSAVDAALGAHLDGYSEVFEVEHRLEHRAGAWRWVIARGLAERDTAGRLVRMAGSLSDVTHRKNAEDRLRYEALHDALTGLSNRTSLIARAHEALKQGRATGEHIALLLIDVDGFRLVNDSFGLSMGDLLLRATGARLARTVRSMDTVARMSGDEFVVLLEGLETPSEVHVVAERITRELSLPFDLRGYAVYATVSMGMVASGIGYDEPEELLRDANIALARAKASGRNQRVSFTHEMRRSTVRRLMLETDLRRALERSELSLVYQPILSLQTGEVMGFEALCRWHHGKHGMIGPSEFIPIAEDSGLIMPIGRWALQAACEDALTWTRWDHQPWVSVNVSGRQLAQPEFIDDLILTVEKTGLPTARLRLEITESVLMENADWAKTVLERVRALGVGISIDDFGTGYSSLAYLRRFPIQTLKIDRAFLSRDGDAEDSWAIVDAIRSLAKVLGLGVIVEGVETEEHLERLSAMRCEAGQGYLMAHPLPADEVCTFLAKRRPKV